MSRSDIKDVLLEPSHTFSLLQRFGSYGRVSKELARMGVVSPNTGKPLARSTIQNVCMSAKGYDSWMEKNKQSKRDLKKKVVVLANQGSEVVDLRLRFLGRTVSWESQASGVKKKKQGKVYAVVGRGADFRDSINGVTEAIKNVKVQRRSANIRLAVLVRIGSRDFWYGPFPSKVTVVGD